VRYIQPDFFKVGRWLRFVAVKFNMADCGVQEVEC
jgi:hypothetical protein